MEDRKKIPVIVLLGPTASGKTRFSLELARTVGGEIIACDSMQVYRGMDIGTGKPSPEERKAVPHHLMDILEPWEAFDVAKYLELADQKAHEIWNRGKIPLLVGGTPLYVKRFIEGIAESPPKDEKVRSRLVDEARIHGVLYLSHRLAQVDPQGALKIHPFDLRRLVRALEVYELTGIPISTLWQEEGKMRDQYCFYFLGLIWPREILYQRINQRVLQMFEAGWLEEVAELQKKGLGREASQALGYKEILEGWSRKTDPSRIVQKIQTRTRHFARRQILWFRQFPQVEWLDLAEEPNWKILAKKWGMEIQEAFSRLES